jgi:CheY-like chemotaxis protein
MHLKAKLSALHQQRLSLTRPELAKLSCQLAKQLEKAGEYEAACEALSDFWPDSAQLPTLEGLAEATRAEVLLRVGNLAGWLGSTDQSHGSQERAKNLITQSIEGFEQLRLQEKVAEARGDLTLCYWREGSFDEARVQIRTALHLLPQESDELRAVLLIRAGIIEERTQQLQEALRFYYEAAPLVETSEDHALKGAYHNEFALLFTRLGTEENRRDYLDKALIEAAAASFHFEQAGNTRFLARVENNLGFLFFTLGQYGDAHKHLDRARYLFIEVKDSGTAAQVDETRARTLLAEGQIVQAERVVRAAVKSLERGGEQAVLAEALNTHGIALARLGHYTRARTLLDRAVNIAETTGDVEGAGRATLSIIEELGDKMNSQELISTFRSALHLSKNSQDPLTLRRLLACIEVVFVSLDVSPSEGGEAGAWSWEDFSFKREIFKHERILIERALRDAGGSITKAAHLLGFKHHQSLISLVGGRHQDLLKLRSTVRKRRRHLFSEPKRAKKISSASPSRASTMPLAILLVEDNKTVASTIEDILVSRGFDVDPCASGTAALKILMSNVHYDVIILDNDLPGLNGIELTRRARNMARWRGTPIIMFSAEDCEREAWRAGVSEFLRKPQDIGRITATIERFVADRVETTK